MTDLIAFRNSLKTGEHLFADTLAFVAEHYTYSPQAFTNGPVHNAAGQNEGSCKVLAMAEMEGFSDLETLQAFGEHYRAVLASPAGNDHGNIRALMAGGMNAVTFDGLPLVRNSINR